MRHGGGARYSACRILSQNGLSQNGYGALFVFLWSGRLTNILLARVSSRAGWRATAPVRRPWWRRFVGCSAPETTSVLRVGRWAWSGTSCRAGFSSGSEVVRGESEFRPPVVQGQSPPGTSLLKQRVRRARLFQWGPMLACSGARAALTLSLLDVRGGQGVHGPPPLVDDVVWDARYVVWSWAVVPLARVPVWARWVSSQGVRGQKKKVLIFKPCYPLAACSHLRTASLWWPPLFCRLLQKFCERQAAAQKKQSTQERFQMPC